MSEVQSAVMKVRSITDLDSVFYDDTEVSSMPVANEASHLREWAESFLADIMFHTGSLERPLIDIRVHIGRGQYLHIYWASDRCVEHTTALAGWKVGLSPCFVGVPVPFSDVIDEANRLISRYNDGTIPPIPPFKG